MILPNHEQCKLVVAEILAEPKSFTGYLVDWAGSNVRREEFTHKQRELIHKWCREYDFDCMKGYT